MNLISKKEMHSLLGKLSHAAGLLIVMRPSMDPLWAAWAAPSPDDHPGCVWAMQILTEVTWFHTFFKGNGTRIERYFSVAAFNRVGTLVEIGTDASPWGLGGWLSIDGTITHYFSSRVDKFDVDKFKYQIGDANGQQLWEALAALVAIDLWSEQWLTDRVVLKVRSDNVSAFTLLTTMRPPPAKDDDGHRVPNTTMAIVARELAMRLVNLSFPPDAEHAPGTGHIIADKLSRVHAPSGNGIVSSDLHPALVNAQVTIAPERKPE